MTTIAQIGDRVKTLLDEYTEKVARTRHAHLELFAQAFLQEVGANPSECELVEETAGNEIRWYFRKRTK